MEGLGANRAFQRIPQRLARRRSELVVELHESLDAALDVAEVHSGL
jgi:hypothetical protein